MMNLSPVLLIVAGIMSIIVWAVAQKAFSENPTLDNGIIPVGVAGLSFIGLITLGRDWIASILLLYAALAIAIFLLLFLGPWLMNRRSHTGDDDQIATPSNDDSLSKQNKHITRKERNYGLNE